MNKSLILFCLLSFCYPAFSQQQRIFHDPFAKPVVQKRQPSSKKKNLSIVASVPWVAKLTSTLRAGKNSMAIVGGQVIKLGEEIDGYKLIKVLERSAVFLKNQQKTRLTLDDDEENESASSL